MLRCDNGIAKLYSPYKIVQGGKLLRFQVQNNDQEILQVINVILGVSTQLESLHIL